MAFEELTDRFNAIFKKLRGQARLTESNMDDMLKEIRIALLQADVNYKVVKDFIAKVREESIHQKVLETLSPSQMVVKIVDEQLTELLGPEDATLNIPSTRPIVIMLVGLQGTGKTTTAGKLSYYFKHKLNKRVLLAACDVYRPAAIEQLQTVGQQVGADVFSLGSDVDPVEIASKAKEKAFNDHYGALIIDTAGRLQIDDQLMDELNNMKEAVSPEEILLVVDAMAGQDAVNVAMAFHEKLDLTGIIMTKLDGDSRGGAALSIKYMSGVPIKFSGTGEKMTDLDIFHPDRMAERILGMGDVLTLVEQAEDNISEKELKKTANRAMSGKFDLNDMVDNLKSVQRMGPLSSIMGMIPGMPKIDKSQMERVEKETVQIEAIVNSMTPEEREHPEILKYSRKQRIANGSGTTLADINRVLKQYEMMKDQMKQMEKYTKSGKMPPNMGGLMR
ncbi:MAG: signal recognition particle protein [Coprobacillus sp.]|nr:signal recognition particle protein [Coprobacillus sp.]